MAEVLQIAPLNEWGRPLELVNAFGSPAAYVDAVRQLQRQIYAVAQVGGTREKSDCA